MKSVVWDNLTYTFLIPKKTGEKPSFVNLATPIYIKRFPYEKETSSISFLTKMFQTMLLLLISTYLRVASKSVPNAPSVVRHI
jgi:hypothetical protein